jgi:hypothetical protein
VAQDNKNVDTSDPADGTNDAVEATLGNGTAVVTWNVTTGEDAGYADNSLDASYANAASATVASGDAFAVGSHVLTATLKDDSLNATTCNFTVVVADTQNPTSIKHICV